MSGTPKDPAGSASGASAFQLAAEIFLAAKALAPAARETMLAERCAGNPALRAQVEKLLAGSQAADDAPPTFDRLGEQLNRAAAAAAGFDGPATDRGGDPTIPAGGPGQPSGGKWGARPAEPTTGGSEPGAEPPLAEPTRVGKYVLLQKIGEGGFGVVYAAEQREPIRRRVAMKIVKPGMGSKEVIARFEAERQALALLDHPNVAKVFEAGTLADGRPYFVMEHVPGVPITDYCDLARLTTRQRLDLFVQVCHAVQHAHQKGIIHRDIKPSNVLVTMFDGKPVPKVIDFGIAKAIHQPLTSSTLYTEVGRLMGTPEYMSPEQAASGGVDVDTRTDVYSLGVLLFQLLTGTLPFEPKALRKAGYDGIIKMISELEPPRPSARFSTLWSQDTQAGTATRTRNTQAGPTSPPKPGAAAASGASIPADDLGHATRIAASHGTDPSSLLRQLRGDLDWIVLRAMEKSRLKRYDSVRELVSDIERSLRHEPIAARPPSTADRLGRFARRHRVALAGGLTIAAGLAIGVLGIAVALVSAKAQNTQLEESVREADAQRVRATDAEAAARKAMEKLAEASDDLRRSRDTAVAKSTEAERLLYITQLARAREAMEQGNNVLASSILAEAPRTMRGWEWTWMVQRCEGAQTRLRHPSDSHVTNASLSPDGSRIVTTHEDGLVIAWDAASGATAWTSRAHDALTQRAVYSPDGRLIASVGYGGQARLLDPTNGRELRRLDGHEGDVWWVDFSADGKLVVTGDESGKVRFFDVAGGRNTRTINAHSKRVWSASFSPDGTKLTTSSFDGTVAVWSLATGKEVARQNFGAAWPWTARYSPDGTKLVIGQYDGSVGIFDAATLALIRPLSRHLGEVFRAEFSADGTRIVTSADDSKIQLHDAATGGLLSTLTLHQAKVRSVVFGADSRSVLSASADGTAMLWRDLSGRGMTVVTDAAEHHNACTFTPDGKQLVVGSRASGIYIYDTVAARLLRPMSGGFPVCATAVSPDGRAVAMAFNRRIAITELATGRVIRELLCPPSWPLAITFSPDGTLLAVSFDRAAPLGSDKQPGASLVVYDLRSGGIAHQDAPAEDGIAEVVFSPDGRVLAAGGNNGSLWLYLVPGGSTGLGGPWARSERARTSEGSAHRVAGLRFVGNDRLRVIDSGGSSELWSLGRGIELPARVVAASMSVAGKIAAVAVSPDSTRLAAVSGMQLVIGDAVSGSQLTTTPLPFSDGHGVCFDPTGRTISVVSASGKVALFELDGGTIAKERLLRRAALAWIDAAQAASPGQPVQAALAGARDIAPELRAAITERAPSRDSPEWLWHLIEVRLGEDEATWAERAESCLPLGRRAAELQPEVTRYRARLALLLAVAGHFQEAASQVEADTGPNAVLRRAMLPSDHLTLALTAVGKGDRSSAASHQQAALEMLVRWPTPDEQHDLADRSLRLLELRGLPRPARKDADREVGTDGSEQPGPR